jgi:hypothetical protein
VQDAEWRNRVRESARADVRAMLRAGRRRRAERWLVTATVLVAILAVLMLLVGVGMFDERQQRAVEPAPGQGQQVVQAVDLDAPFAGTPAAGWADGAEGITVPAPMQVGEFSAEEVAAATKQVREALIASRLDPEMLVGHNPDAYLGALAPDARKLLKPLFGTGREPQAQALVSLIAPGNPLLDVEPKVTGTMTVEAGAPNQLIIHTNYLFAYAFEPDDPSAVSDPMDLIVLVRAQVDYRLLKEGYTEDSLGLWYGHVGGFGYSIACDWYKKGFLAPAARDQSAAHLPAPGHDRTDQQRDREPVVHGGQGAAQRARHRAGIAVVDQPPPVAHADVPGQPHRHPVRRRPRELRVPPVGLAVHHPPRVPERRGEVPGGQCQRIARIVLGARDDETGRPAGGGLVLAHGRPQPRPRRGRPAPRRSP